MDRKKGLFIVFGESFRIGGKFTRLRDTPESIPLQKLASLSHMVLCEHIEKKYDIEVDFAFTTYTTPNYDLLKSYYKPIKYEFLYDWLIGQDNLLKSVLTTIDINQYEFIFLMRFDLCFKPYFLEIFNPLNDKITVLSLCWILGWKINTDNPNIFYPRTAGAICLVPKKYFKTISSVLFFDHDIIAEYVRHNMLQLSDFDYMLNTLHDGCSEWDYNPAYIMVSRSVQHNWISYGWIYDKMLGRPRKWDTPITYPDYQGQLGRPSLKSYHNFRGDIMQMLTDAENEINNL